MTVRDWFRGGRGRRSLTAVVLSLGFAASASAAAQHPASEPTVTVPRLGGGLLTAYRRLHARGLRVSIPHGFAFDSTNPPPVVRATPGSGRRLAPGSVVTLYLGRASYRAPRAHGPFRRYRVPRLVGTTADRAYVWVRARTVAFRAYLGALSGGTGASLLANYRVTAQRPAPGKTLSTGVSGRVAKGRPNAIRSLTVWGAQPPPPPPQAQTGPATVSGPTGAALAGTVNPQGSPTTYFFSYGATSAYGSQSASESVGAGKTPSQVTTTLASLSPVTTYHYRLVASSRAGTSYGADQTFTTSGYYQNPVFSPAAFPDPFVLDNGGGHSDYWAFATGDRFPVMHSTDLVNWSDEGTAMTARPSWVTSASDWHPWAPSVVATPCPGGGAGSCYVMYYVGLSKQWNVNCIGVATASSPGGPYTDQGPLDLATVTDPTAAPVGCKDALGQGNIDPSPFIDPSGQPYLYVSTDFSCTSGNCTLQPTISVIPLSSDLLHATGPRTPLFSGDPGTWEGAGVNPPTVEGPSMTWHDGTYYLFYSGGSWRGAYGMGYATSTSPTGPFTKSPANPILSEGANVLGPGGGDQLVTGPHGGLWLPYAARSSSYGNPRTLRIDPFSWQPPPAAGGAAVPVIHGPTSTPQPTQP